MKAWQVGVTNVGATSSATMTWRSSGQLRVSVIVKAVFAFAPNETMCLAPPEPILDVDAEDPPKKSIRSSSDRYPFRPRVDVVFVGHAYAPGGTPAKRISARIAIAQGNEKSLDKLIDVIGDRASPQADPVPFIQMPVTYERAYGGPGFDANPAGVGFGLNAHMMPNIVYPHGWHKDTEPAALGPIATSWPRRLRLAANQPIDFSSKTVTEIPPHVDLSYFQCAPEDQRLTQLQGGAWILLENLHPKHTRLTTRLPDVQGAAMVFGDDGVDTPIAMRADTLVIDGDRQVCILTFRGSHPVPNEAALDQLRIAAGIESIRAPIDWTAAKNNMKMSGQSGTETAVLDADAPIEFKSPFAISEPHTSPAPATAAVPIPGAPFAVVAAPAPVPSPVGASTMVLTDEADFPPDFDALLRQADPLTRAQSPAENKPAPPPIEHQAPAEEKKEWSWAAPAPTDSSMQQKSAAPAKPPAKPTEPPARSVIYGGFTGKK